MWSACCSEADHNANEIRGAMQSYRTYRVELPMPEAQAQKSQAVDPLDPLPRPRSSPRLQASAMAAVRQAAEEAIIEVVEAGDIEGSKQATPQACCEIKVSVEESSLYVRMICIAAVVIMVSLSVLGLILTMMNPVSTEEACFSQWVWMVFALSYASIMLLSEINSQGPSGKDSFQAQVYRCAPLLATQVGRAGFFGVVGMQSLFIRPMYLGVPSCIVLCLGAMLLALDTKFRCGRFTQATDAQSDGMETTDSNASGQQQMMRVIEGRQVTPERVMPRVTLGLEDSHA